MKLENTGCANYKFVVDEFGIRVAMQINGFIKYRLYDRVRVTDDGRGYICPMIDRPGFGRIVEIRKDDTDYFFGVLMDNGQFGFMKDARMEKVVE